LFRERPEDLVGEVDEWRQEFRNASCRHQLPYKHDWVLYFIPPQNSRGVTPLPFTAVAPAGSANARLYASYFDHDPDGSNTNIYVRYSDDGGKRLSAISECPLEAWAVLCQSQSGRPFLSLHPVSFLFILPHDAAKLAMIPAPGIVTRRWFSALYKSFNSSTYSFFKLSFSDAHDLGCSRLENTFGDVYHTESHTLSKATQVPPWPSKPGRVDRKNVPPYV
jgi:hypothetical protein